MALASATPTEIDDLLLFGKQHTQQHLDLFQAVKSELKLEESDNKSQYEESVVQPPTPPESYTTNDEKLLDTLTEQELSTASLPAAAAAAALEEANAKLHLRSAQSDNKMAVPLVGRQQATPQYVSSNGNNAPPVLEAYDLTSVTETPPPSTPNSTVSTNSSTTNSTTTANNCAVFPILGRKARIGKTMAREMVYAGAAANVTAQTQSSLQTHTTPMIHVRTLPQQPHAIVQPQQQLQQPPTQTQPHQQTQTQFVALQSEQLLTAITPSPSPQVPATLSESFPAAEIAQSTLQTPFILKTEIKAEKIKLEDDEPLLNAVLQMQQQQESNHNHDKDNEKAELKLIKAEPLTLNCEDVSAEVSDAMATPTLKPLGML